MICQKHREVSLIQHYVIKFVSDLLLAADSRFQRVLRFPPPINWPKICQKHRELTLINCQWFNVVKNKVNNIQLYHSNNKSYKIKGYFYFNFNGWNQKSWIVLLYDFKISFFLKINIIFKKNLYFVLAISSVSWTLVFSRFWNLTLNWPI
jgi:hypothetical protein